MQSCVRRKSTGLAAGLVFQLCLPRVSVGEKCVSAMKNVEEIHRKDTENVGMAQRTGPEDQVVT